MLEQLKIGNILFLDIETVPAFSSWNYIPGNIRIRLPALFEVSCKRPLKIKYNNRLELWKSGDYKHYVSLELLTAIFVNASPKFRFGWKSGCPGIENFLTFNRLKHKFPYNENYSYLRLYRPVQLALLAGSITK
jgi:hypothetical protein